MEKREAWADRVKITACVLVVIGHILRGSLSAGIIPLESGIAPFIIDFLYCFHIQLFFVCSGYFYRKYTARKGISGHMSVMLKKFVALGIPYVIFTTIQVLLKSEFASAVNSRAGTLIERLFVNPDAPFWYIYALIFMFIITPLIKTKRGMIIPFAIAATYKIVLQIVLAMILNTAERGGNVMLSASMLSTLDRLYGFAGYYMWFCAGMIIAQGDIIGRLEMVRAKKVIGAGIFALSVTFFAVMRVCRVTNELCNIATAILACAGILLFILGMKHKYTKLERLVCACSFPLFLTHTIAAPGVRIILAREGIMAAAPQIILQIAAALAVGLLFCIIAEESFTVRWIIYPWRNIMQLRESKTNKNSSNQS